MGVTWSSYKEKRREKKELKRFENSFVVFIFGGKKEKKKLEHASYTIMAMKKKNF